MRWLDILVLALLFLAIGIGIYVLQNSWPGQITQFQGQSMDGKTSSVYTNGSQFYPNMRFPDKIITYSIATNCSDKKTKSAKEAFSILSSKTILIFNEIPTNGEIDILCSNVAPDPTDKGHFIAGEGGPNEIYISGPYNVIMSGQVSLYRDDKCQEPKIATHEILHALGFDHNSNSSSIMFPITSCDEQIDQYIISEINRLYSIPSASDLTITKANAEKSGRYLSFQTEIANYGFVNAKEVNLTIYANNKTIKEFAFGEIPLGNKKQIKVSNLAIPKDTSEISFEAYLADNSAEISLTNNRIDLNVVSQ